MATTYSKTKTFGVTLTRFCGRDGVCLQLTKQNCYEGGVKQLTLKEAKTFKKSLIKFSQVKLPHVYYCIDENFYIDCKQAKNLATDLDLFINDTIHKGN